MKERAREISFRGKVQSRDLSAALLNAPGDAVLVERGKPRLLILQCPCGCGDDLLINLDRRAGAAWYLYLNQKGLTLFPSYWRDDRCGSHFILWNSHIYWCHGFETNESEDWQVSTEIEQRVYLMLTNEEFLSYELVAKQLELIPWEALQACRQLVRSKKAVSGDGLRRGMYRRIKTD